MPVNYQYFQKLQFLLQNPEARWQDALKERLTAIDNELAKVKDKMEARLASIQYRIDNCKDENTKLDLIKHSEKIKKYTIPYLEKPLLDEKEQILSPTNNTFPIGAAPFEGIRAAKFLLENIHVLEMPNLNQDNRPLSKLVI